MPKSYLLPILLLCFSIACCTDEVGPPEAQVNYFEIRGMGAFILDDSLMFAAQTDSTYYLRFLMQPVKASAYISINNQPFVHQTAPWLKIDSTISSVRVSATPQPKHSGYKGGVKMIVFGYGQKALIPESKLYPNPVQDSVAFEFSAQTRGLVQTVISDLTGRIVFSSSTIKYSDEYRQKKPLGSLKTGLYILRVGHGDSQTLVRFIKE